MSRLHLALFLLSLAVVGFQIVFMQILSLLQWQHFASLVISVALLGFGCSGTLLALARPWFLRHHQALVPILMLLSALAMAGALPLGHALFGQFDPQLLIVDGRQRWLLLATQAALFLPMLCAALAIGLLFSCRTERIGSLYFANLLGSAGGGIALLWLMAWLLPARLPGVCALLALAAALVALTDQQSPVRRWTLALCGATGVAVALSILQPPALNPSPYKAISYALALPDASVSAAQPSPYGFLQRVAAPALRYAPELSLTFSGQIPRQDRVFSNGDALGPAHGATFDQSAQLLDASPRALAYALGSPRQVLVLGAGTGLRARYAQLRGVQTVIAQQQHRAAPRFLADQRPPAGAIDWRPGQARALLARERRQFDLILLPDVGAPGGDAGLNALAHDYLLTVEGLNAVWRRLAQDGVIQVSAWIDQPLRSPLRLAGCLVALLEAQGIEQPPAHLAAIRSWASVTFLLSRRPLSEQAAQKLRAFSRQLQLDPVLLPGLQGAERSQFHAANDAPLLALLEQMVYGERRLLARNYPFRLAPPTDDRPFFAQFLPGQPLAQLRQLSDGRPMPGAEFGYLLLLLTFAQLLLASMLFVAAPLLLRSRARAGATEPASNRRAYLSTGVYFAAIGLGFMCFEIALLHQLVFYLGEPVFAAAGAIAGVLLFSGIGSYLSERCPSKLPGPLGATLGIALLIALFGAFATAVLRDAVALALALRLLLLCLLLAAPTLLMGLPFPTALGRLAASRPALIPWGWAVNGCFSVLAVPLASLLAVEAGFAVVLWFSALSYLVAALAATALPRAGLR